MQALGILLLVLLIIVPTAAIIIYVIDRHDNYVESQYNYRIKTFDGDVVKYYYTDDTPKINGTIVSFDNKILGGQFEVIKLRD